jgi:hypothetical protein
MASRRIPSPIQSIALIVTLLTLAATVGALANSLRTDECLSAPDSPSPQGTHWYYRLDLPTQRKCWYLRAPVRSLRRAAEAARATPDECLSAPDSPSPQGTHWYYRLDLPTQRKCWYLRAPVRSLRRAAEAVRATAVLFGRRHSVDGPPISVDPGDTASRSSRVDMTPVDRPTSEGITATGHTLIQQSVPETFGEPAPIGTPVPRANTLSQTGNEADGPLVAPTTWPDHLPTSATVQTQKPIADPINAPADSGPIDPAKNAGGNKLTDNAGNFMAAIVAFLALGLAAVCVVAKNLVARREPTIIDHRDLLESGHDRRRSVDEGQLLLSALSEREPVRSDDVPFETALEIRKRKDKLARLHQNLDRLLHSPTTA